MKKTISSLVLSLALITGANAGDYTVQVGAYRVLTQEAIEKAENYGEVIQRRGNDNLERLSVGRFSSRSEANNMRDTLRSSGFSGAFITSLDNGTPSVSHSNHSFASSDDLVQDITPKSISQRSSSYSINDLSSDERIKASYLDGQLRILSNGQFYTVEQYRQQNQY